MKQQVGGLLAAALGAVLLTGGLSGGASGAVGNVTPCGTSQVGFTGECPTGAFAITEHDGAVTTTNAQPGVSSRVATGVPATWTVTISTATSGCSISDEGGVDVVAVPDSGSADSGQLEEYTDTSNVTKCAYTLTETVVAGYAASFNPVNPQTLGAVAGDGPSIANTSVLLTNTVTTTSSPSPTPTVSTSATPTPSASVSVTPDAVVDATSTDAVAPADTDMEATLPFTGARAPVKPSVIIGIALILLGATVFGHGQYAGRRRPRRH